MRCGRELANCSFASINRAAPVSKIIEANAFAYAPWIRTQTLVQRQSDILVGSADIFVNRSAATAPRFQDGG